MSEIAVQVDSVWKKFRRGERQDSLRDLVPALVRRWTGRKPNSQEIKNDEFWALRDVSLTALRGEAIGIIGHNGAGKSTLLKILTRLLRPTAGTYQTHGRVGALIEVTAGFHPDLTGRENVYLNGAILGLRKAEIARRFEEIVEFSGISEFIDTPVKRYSSGMNARLGFSIAAHLDPDVLIVDEVLSVGDYMFQAKCVEWMRRTLDSGTTVIFVSHNMDAVMALCKSAILLNHGRVLAQGKMTDVIAEYYNSGGSRPELRPDACARVTRFASDISGEPVVDPGQRVTFTQEFVTERDVSLTPGFFMKRDNKMVVATTYGRMHGQPLLARAGECLRLDWTLSLNVPAGAYEVGHHLEDASGGYHDFQSHGCVVTVRDDPRVVADCYVGLDVRLQAR
ncbi:MAG: polysaccharide ABC transporter ATP-binding protein [Gemmatimonadota bacterium]|nr:polysaccharide ABC transporter ATP-binding protein [Gemmatimonadota bacterium]